MTINVSFTVALPADRGEAEACASERPALAAGVSHVTRTVVARYEALDVYSAKRAEVQREIREGTEAAFRSRRVSLDSLVLQDVVLPEAYRMVIQLRKEAEQEQRKIERRTLEEQRGLLVRELAALRARLSTLKKQTAEAEARMQPGTPAQDPPSSEANERRRLLQHMSEELEKQESDLQRQADLLDRQLSEQAPAQASESSSSSGKTPPLSDGIRDALAPRTARR